MADLDTLKAQKAAQDAQRKQALDKVHQANQRSK